MPRKAATKARAAAPGLSEERILRGAVELADAEGIESLSMRNLATKLGVEAMSLYHHVTNKDELLDGLVELVLSEIDVPRADASDRNWRRDWKDGMRTRALSARQALLRHRWATVLIESRMTVGPVRLTYADSVLGVLRKGGFSIELAYQAFMTLDSYIYGFTLQEVSWAYEPEEQAAVVERFRPLVPPSQYPHMTEVMGFVAQRRTKELAASKGAKKGAKGARSSAGYDDEFAFGLDLILDGLERARDRL